jgi:hypothetical protein
MRRRTDPTATPATAQPAHPVPPLAPGAHDWVSPPASPEAIPAARVPDLRRQADAAATRSEKVAGLAPGPAGDVLRMSAGDTLTVTMGKELIFPVKFNGFEVGPLSTTVTVRDGETPAHAYDRARGVLEQLYAAEFDLQLAQFVEHVDRARQKARPE